MKTATITFHAAHNYGSVLQAYALQNVLFNLGVSNDIINLRTERQKDIYSVYTKRKGVKYKIKNLTHLFYSVSLKKRYDKFENFINNHLNITEEFSSEKELKESNFDYDIYIAGSDQIWNPVPVDFDWSYYLTFVNKGKKVAYAPSFGQLSSSGDEETQNRIAEELSNFESISVRETGSQSIVEKLAGKNAELVLDPTLLLPKQNWLELFDNSIKLVKGDYIFFYTLFADSNRIRIVKEIGKQLNLPIVTSNFSNQYDVITPFKKIYDAGPLDFLSLINNAKLVVTSSFHGSVFSTLLNIPFFAIDGMTDARIEHLLRITSLESRAITVDNIKIKLKSAFDVDFSYANKQLSILRDKSVNYIKKIVTL